LDLKVHLLNLYLEREKKTESDYLKYYLNKNPEYAATELMLREKTNGLHEKEEVAEHEWENWEV
jgi:hypothetical protein